MFLGMYCQNIFDKIQHPFVVKIQQIGHWSKTPQHNKDTNKWKGISCSFILWYPICWHILVHSSLLWSSAFMWYQFNVSSFIYNFICLCLLSYLVILAKDLSGLFFFYLFKIPTFCFINLLNCFSSFYFIYFCPLLFPSFVNFRLGLFLFCCRGCWGLHCLQVQQLGAKKGRHGSWSWWYIHIWLRDQL